MNLRCAALAVLLTRPVVGQDLPTVDEIASYLDDLYRSTSSHSIMTMTVARERGTRTLTLESWTQGTEEALIVIRAPARERGTATLRTDDGLWNYAPRADRLIRIPSGLLSDSWMGSHFTNDDLLRDTGYQDDHDLAVGMIEGQESPLIQVTMTPKPETPVVYTRLVFVLNHDTWVPIRADYFDEDELIRSMLFDQVEVVSGRHIPMRMVLQPSDKPDEYTEVVYDELEFAVDVSDDMFTRRGLRRIARN